jgi:hypothetical protein
MHRDELALDMRGKLTDLQTKIGQHTLYLVAVGLTLGSAVEIEEATLVGRDLDRLVAEASRPFGDPRQRVEGRLVADELCEEQRGSLECPHGLSSLRGCWAGSAPSTVCP